MESRRNLLLALSVLCRLLLPIAALAQRRCEFPAIFNFGDSNSDTGGLSATFGPVPPPCGESFPGTPAGRYCDGRLLIDLIAESLDLPYLSAYVDSIGANFSHGANFASAGATITMPNGTIFKTRESPFYLQVQTSNFEQFKSRSLAFRLNGGAWKDMLPEESYFSEALYTFDIGQNDLTRAIFRKYGAEEVKSLVNELVDIFATAVKSVYEQGGRKFLIHGTSPLGCLPYVLVLAPPRTAADLDPFGCGIHHNEVPRLFNVELKAKVASLRKEMPAAAFTFVDMYSAKYALITQAANYGFEKPLTSCCGYGGGEYNYNNNIRCGAKATVNGTVIVVDKPCQNPERSVSWDGIHFTEAANEWVFKQIYDGKYSDPPLPISMACYQADQVL